MDRIITLALSDIFVGQILDVLRFEQDAWAYTQSYLLGGPLDMERLIKVHSTPTDAGKMVAFYQDIIDAVEQQYQATNPNR
ncbi:MAG: hypothetical protein HN350_03965 [Phycisphaerales bacterium]|nr:hypothetical protein [Phycisphaerales bacterium]